MREQMAAIAAELEDVVGAPQETELAAQPAGEETQQLSAEAGAEETPGAEDNWTVARLAEAIEVDPEFLYEVEMGFGDDQPPMKLGEIKDRFQEANNKVHQMERMLANQQQQYQLVSGMFQIGEKVLTAKSRLDQVQSAMQNINWDEMAQKDPGMAFKRQRQYQDAAKAAQQELEQAVGEQQQATQARAMYVAHALHQSIPDWRDPIVEAADRQAIVSVAGEYGFAPGEIQMQGSTDPRIMMLLRDFMQLKAGQQAGRQHMETVRKAPKPITGGARRVIPASGKLNEQVRRAKKTGNKHDVLAAQRALVDQAGGI